MIKSQTEVNDIEEGLSEKNNTYIYPKNNKFISKANVWYPSITSNLIFTGLLKISGQEIKSFTRFCFDNKYLLKLKKSSQYLLFQLAMQKIHMMWNISYMFPLFCFNKNTKSFIDLSDWFLHLSTIWTMLLQGILQVEWNCSYTIKNMDTQAQLKL